MTSTHPTHPNCFSCPDRPRACHGCLVHLGQGLPTLTLSEEKRAALNRKLVKEGYASRFWDTLHFKTLPLTDITYQVALAPFRGSWLGSLMPIQPH